MLLGYSMASGYGMASLLCRNKDLAHTSFVIVSTQKPGFGCSANSPKLQAEALKRYFLFSAVSDGRKSSLLNYEGGLNNRGIILILSCRNPFCCRNNYDGLLVSHVKEHTSLGQQNMFSGASQPSQPSQHVRTSNTIQGDMLQTEILVALRRRSCQFNASQHVSPVNDKS